ncbi:MAG: type IV pilin N-terminal domain-containing protein [Candidatus Methanoperedens sp.]|nr:type IV pilin N-terminal domain-containing protein [Candidatus Methanoperedens sp.]
MKIKNIKFGSNRNILKDDRGVSPVIAVILMVAITVVMAAIVSSWSAGVKAPTSPTTVGLDISRSTDNITVVVTAIDPASSSPIPFINFSYNKYDNGYFYTNYSNITNADVGNSIELKTNSSEIKQLVITARFKDGTKKVLYSRDV